MCGRNVQCESDPLLTRSAKVQRKTIGSPICPSTRDEMSVTFLHFTVYQLVTKAKIWGINLSDYRILLNIRQIGGVLYIVGLEPVVRSWV